MREDGYFLNKDYAICSNSAADNVTWIGEPLPLHIYVMAETAVETHPEKQHHLIWDSYWITFDSKR